MKHSQKMALVPFDQVMNVSKPEEPSPSTSDDAKKVPRDILKDKIVSLDNKMRTILEDSSLSANQKVLQYNAALDEYLLFNEKIINQGRLPKDGMFQKTYESDSDEEKDIVRESLINTLPPSYQKNGELILDYLKRAGTSWNSIGTLMDNGREIEGSNIVDLVHFLLRRKRKNVSPPNALSTFRQLLQKANLPKNLLHLSKEPSAAAPVPSSDSSGTPPLSPLLGHGSAKITKWDPY